jgi:hypothetical protein
MKNIHVLPTDKPSRLHFDGKLFLSPNYQDSKTINSIVEGRNIYITSDEEIKEGDWVLGDYPDNPICKVIAKYGQEFTAQSLNGDKYGLAEYDSKKIILTTDQDLIKGGVQAIDDEFLEWFVKNPSCERVEIERGYLGIAGFCKSNEIISKDKVYYKIIIPKEELSKDEIDKFFVDMICNPKEELKQETLEYNLLQHIKFCLECKNESQAIRLIEKYGFVKQEERYTEQELKLWLKHRDVYLYNHYTTYIKSGLSLQSVEDFIKESHEYLMDREQFKKKQEHE